MKENKKELIAEVVRDLINERGDTAFTVEEIAKRAGIGKGTVYLYFRDKDEIFIFTFFHFLENFLDELEENLGKKGSTIEKLMSIFEIQVHQMREMLSFWETLFRGVGKKEDKKWVPEKMKKIKERHISIISRIVEEGQRRGEIRGDIAPEDIARIIYMLIRGLTSHLAFNRENLHSDREISALLTKIKEVLLNGVSSSNN